MIWVIAVVDDELLRGCEVALDTVHPGSVCSGEDEFDIGRLAPLKDFLLHMGSHVVQDDKQLLLISIPASDGLEEAEHFLPALSFLVMHPQQVLVDVVGSQKMGDAFKPVIRGAMSEGGVLWRPGAARLWLHLDGPELVEADDTRPFRRFLVEGRDAFFLAS